ncbi:M48 family metallopeptidase [Eubacterium sp.]|uniref:M48 family metallopeptidase n=1 Tax=Eubacterium sp. TaxID=142586 RepID=UPI003522B1E6
MCLEIKHDGTLIVRVPFFMRNDDVLKFVNSKQDWINSHLSKIKNNQADLENNYLTKDEINNLISTASDYIPTRVSYFAKIMGVSYNRISIRTQKTRWGSCSSKGNLNFNALLMLTSKDVIDYVVIHELSHRIEMNHSPRFWSIVENVLPNYRVQRKWLKENGYKLISRIPR